MEPATDLDILVKRGFDREEAQNALRETQGNVDAAVKLMITGHTVTEWAGSAPGDWRDNADSQISFNAKSRALCKSEYYISVPSWKRKEIANGDVKIHYQMNIILRDGRKWKLEKRYSAFHTFWRSLPMGSCKNFENPFPQPFIRLATPTDEMYESRGNQLDLWMREMCLDEKSMTNPKLISRLRMFIEADAHGDAPSGVDFGDANEWTLIPTVPCQTAFHCKNA
jgi:hypothetical protein